MPTIYNPNKRKGLFFIPSGAIKSESAAFSYSQDSYRVDESNPTPTITGDTGGTFTATPEGLTLNSSTGEITLSSSVINSYVVTYTLPSGTFESRNLGIEAAAFASTRSFSFDGVDDYFDIGTISSINSASACTISYWAKKASASGDDMTVGSQLTSTNGIWLQWYTDNNVYFSPRNGSSNYVTVSLTGDTNWHHLLGVYDGTNMTIYIDGAQAATSTTSVPASLSATAGNNFQIGALNGSFFTSGSIDEVAVWNSALSSDAVTEIYNSGVPNDLDELTNASDPTVWYRMGE
jgi:hypothetical protein